MTDTLLISDLHLSGEHPTTIDLFLRFLEEQASKARQLYILGDLFDTWIGDDHLTPPIQEVCQTMKKSAQAGCQLFFMHGNRDFLIGDAFMEASGCQLLVDPTVIEIAGTPTLLMHGDLLCSDDTEYQQARHLLRSQAFIADFLSKSIPQRMVLADEYRKKSGTAISSKSTATMDVSQQTVIEFMQAHKVHRLIHGHTHRPAVHEFDLNEKPAQRIVLADWQGQSGSYLRITESGLSSKTITI